MVHALGGDEKNQQQNHHCTHAHFGVFLQNILEKFQATPNIAQYPAKRKNRGASDTPRCEGAKLWIASLCAVGYGGNFRLPSWFCLGQVLNTPRSVAP